MRRRRVLASLLLGGLALLASCIESRLVPCGDVACPTDQVCTPGGCALLEEVRACAGIGEGDPCAAPSGSVGTCLSGACRAGSCGNDRLDPGEQCDDGNADSGDGCRGDCQKLELCGDAVVDDGEACDDGNTNAVDGCDACGRTTWIATTSVGSPLIATDTAVAQPASVATDTDGHVFVASTHQVRRIDPDGSIRVIAGTGVAGYGGDGGGATNALLSGPGYLAIDGLGRVFVADTSNHAIRRIDPDGTIVTIAGTGVTGFTGDGGLATAARLARPSAVALDALGRVFIADDGNYRLRRIELDGTIMTIAGTGGSTSAGDGGPALQASFGLVRGLAVDESGQVFYSDTQNARVKKIQLDGNVAHVAGTGSTSYNGDDRLATGASLHPYGLAFDTQGRLLIAEATGRRVRRIATDGMITTVAGNGTDGFSGDGGAATSAQLSVPQAVAGDAQGRIVIGDLFNHRVRRVDAAGTITTIAGTGITGARDDGLPATSVAQVAIENVAYDAQGRLLVADSGRYRVVRRELDGSMTTLAGTGLDGSTGDGGPATSARLRPHGIALDSMGRLLLSERFSHKVRRVDLTTGIITTIAGTGTAGTAGDGGAATLAQLSDPYGLAVDALDRILIVELSGHKLRRIEADGTIVTIAGTGTSGTAGDGGFAVAAQLSTPVGVAVDSLGRISISELGPKDVRRIDETGVITTIAAGLGFPMGLAVDAQERVIIADRGARVVRRVETDGSLSTIAGTGAAGMDGDAGPASTAVIDSPQAIAVDSTGRIAIADPASRVVREVAPTTDIITTAVGRIDPLDVVTGAVATARLGDARAISTVGTTTYVASGATGTLERIRDGRVEVVAGRYPQATPTGNLARFRNRTFGSVGGVAVDPVSGTIYITETTRHRVHAITPVDPTKPATWTIAVAINAGGLPGSTDGLGTAAELRSPEGLWFSPTTRTLYIADTGNHMIRALAVDTGTVSTVVNTRHSMGFDGDGGGPTAARLCGPSALTTCGDEMFIADTCNHRVRRVAAGTISTVLGDGVAASSGEGSPASTFPVDSPRGLACDLEGNLFVSSSSTVRLLPAAAKVVDGTGEVQTIYGRSTAFPASHTSCLTGVRATSSTTVEITDACTGLVVNLARVAAP